MDLILVLKRLCLKGTEPETLKIGGFVLGVVDTGKQNNVDVSND